MTFEWSPQHVAARDTARAVAQTLQSKAAEIDRNAAIPGDIARDVKALASADLFATVVSAEEIAVVSPAVAAVIAATDGGRPIGLSGLRGGTAIEDSPRARLVLAAVALGIGKAAVDAALAEIRQTKATAGADVEKPHWVVADAATEIDAARLLTYKAAQTSSDADIALARLMASAAAARAVDAAVRVGGAAALVEGGIIERLSRDVRAVSVLLGTEEDQRAMAAEGVLPH